MPEGLVLVNRVEQMIFSVSALDYWAVLRNRYSQNLGKLRGYHDILKGKLELGARGLDSSPRC